MLTAFIRAFRTPDLRKKLLFTLGIIALFRFGSSLPAPGINETNVSLLLEPRVEERRRERARRSSTCSAATR